MPVQEMQEMWVPSGSGRSSGGGNGNPLKYACLENPMGRGTWRATVHGVGVAKELDTTEHTHTHIDYEYIYLIVYPRASSGPEGMGALFSSQRSGSSDSLANRRLMQGEEQMKKIRSAHCRKQLHGNRIQGNSSQAAASGAGLS